MTNPRSRRTLLIGAVLAVLLAGGAPTSAAPGTPAAQAVSGPTAKFYGYLTPLVVISKGGALTYTNLDVERHNVEQDVTADNGVHGSSKRPWCKLFPSGKCPIFYSALIGLGGSEAVKGLQYVTPGTVYTFTCSLHPGMKGKLVVTP